MRLDPIRMVPSDPAWPVSFQVECDRLTAVLAEHLVRPIEHMGSTSIPALVAKPIIDMVAVVDDINSATGSIEPLAAIGWLHAPQPSDEIERSLSFCTPSIERRTHHLHVVEKSSTPWRGWLAFRDHLRAHPALARDYGALKVRLAAEHGGDDPNQRDGYRAGKADWVESVTRQAQLRD